MTYYGRWTYKYEIAAEKGAAAAILVHEEGPAGYPFSVVQGSWSRENFDIAEPADGRRPQRPAVEGWIDLDTATEALEGGRAGLRRPQEGRRRPRSSGPSRSNTKAEFAVDTTMRQVQSTNLVARLEGAAPDHRDEHVIYTAHWDHLGRDPNLRGDQIYNGALDNASGVATVLEIARGFTRIQPPPKRSILFLLVTAEEKGLLGSKYYAAHPLYPLERTLADINIDVRQRLGTHAGHHQHRHGAVEPRRSCLVEVAKTQDRVVKPDAEPEKGYYYRSDHFEFAKRGVPALDPEGGRDLIDKPDGFGKQKSGRVHRERLPQGQRPDQTRLGPLRRGRGRAAAA